jgi:hypothetical protein
MAPMLSPQTWDKCASSPHQTWQIREEDVLMQKLDEKGDTIKEYLQNMTCYELSYNSKTLKFTHKIFETRPAAGFAVYIALHGGGSTLLELTTITGI